MMAPLARQQVLRSVNMGKIQKNIVEDTKKVAFHVKSDSGVISRERSVPAAGGTDFSWRFLWLTGTTRVIFCAPLVKHACAHLAQDTHFNLAPIASVAPDQTKHAWDGYKFLALTGCARTTGFVSTLTSLL